MLSATSCGSHVLVIVVGTSACQKTVNLPALAAPVDIFVQVRSCSTCRAIGVITVMEIAPGRPDKTGFPAAVARIDPTTIAVTRSRGAWVVLELIVGESNIVAIIGDDDPMVIGELVDLSGELIYLLPANSNLTAVADSYSLIDQS
jgi:hypothetical protein